MTLLDGIVVLECSHDLVAANIGLRLSQLGAHVVRVVDCSVGDRLTQMSYYNQYVDDKSLLYYSKCRGKESLELNPQVEEDRLKLKELLSKVDVVVYNYNDNIFSNFGVDPTVFREEYPRMVVAEYSDYGSHTIYNNRVGDELLVQALSGITLLTGNRDDAPTPMGFTVATQFCAAYLSQGLLAALYRREICGGRGSRVSTSLLEATIQVQMEVVTTAANSGMTTPKRTIIGNAHAGLPAPYGVYKSRDGYFAMSMISIPYLASIMGVEIPEQWIPRESWLTYRDEIMEFLAGHFETRTNREWMELFTPLDVWCSEINDLKATLNLEAYRALELERDYPLPNGASFRTTGLPYRIETTPCGSTCERDDVAKDAPLDGVTVVDISQFLSGPTSTLQLGDFGAKVVKIERPQGGDSGRTVIINNLLLDETSSSFLTVGRNKRSAALDLKVEEQRAMVGGLLAQANVIVHNFRPGVMERMGLDYESVKRTNPGVIYVEISGYGQSGCWVKKPGQDFIVQALSGICMVSGDQASAPVPIGLSVIDLITGAHVDEAVCAALYNRARCGEGAHITATMLASAMDLQSDFITALRYNERGEYLRSKVANSHSGEGAPCGIYATNDGYIAIGAAPIEVIIGQIPEVDPTLAWREREDTIKQAVARSLAKRSTNYWLERLGATSGEIYDWQQLFYSPFGESLGMLQEVTRGNGFRYKTTRCAVRFNDKIMTYPQGAPNVGEYTDQIIDEYKLKP